MAKTDMERIGLFSEMGYVTIKDPYSSSYISKLLEIWTSSYIYRGRTYPGSVHI